MYTKEELISLIHEEIDQAESYQDDYIQSSDYANNYFEDKPDHISKDEKVERVSKLLSHHSVPKSVRSVIEDLDLEVKLFDLLYRDTDRTYQGSIHAYDTVIDSAVIGEIEVDFGTFSNLQPSEMDDAAWMEIVNEACECYKGNVYLKRMSGEWYGCITYDYEMIVISVEEDDLNQAIESLFDDKVESISSYYAKQLSEDYNWDKVKDECKSSLQVDDDNEDQLIGRSLLGSVFSITPSGKVYAPWTSNCSSLEASLDSIWSEALETVLDSHDLYRDDHEEMIFACISVGLDDLPSTSEAMDESGYGFFDSDAHDAWHSYVTDNAE